MKLIQVDELSFRKDLFQPTIVAGIAVCIFAGQIGDSFDGKSGG